MKNSAKKVKCLDFLDQENVWRMPQFFQNYGKQVLILHVSVDMQSCTVLWLDGVQMTDQFRENNPDFPTDCIFGLQLPLPSSSRLAYSKSFECNVSIAVKMSINFYL